jgi:hypothetical protein
MFTETAECNTPLSEPFRIKLTELHVIRYEIHATENQTTVTYCHVYARQKWRVLVRMIGFISTLVTTSFNYTQTQAIQCYH